MKSVENLIASGRSEGVDIEVRNLSVTAEDGTRVLTNLNLTIGSGEYVAVSGVNGSGKSTLAHVLLGLAGRSLHVDGQILLNGLDIYGPRISAGDRTRIRGALFSYVPKVPSLDSTLSVERTISRPFLLRGTRPDHDRLADLLKLFDLSGHRHSPVRHLSSGYQQRVNLVRGLVADACVLVLDEPTDALDPQQKEFVLDRLSDYSARGTILIVSHEHTTARRIVRLHGGELIAT